MTFPKRISNDRYQGLCQVAGEKFNVYFGVVLMNRVADGLEIIGLDVSSPNNLYEALMLNELLLIRKFVHKFIEENQFLFRLLEENRVDLQALIGPKFQKADIPVTANLLPRKQFLHDLGIEIPNVLSERDDEILKLLLEGNSASQIAKMLYRSCRTIEHAIEKIKNKLVCFSKSDLIKKARELEQLGYFKQ